ncbi:AzlC family ABC transporter permease [Thalassobacillus sp. CUG 92003]|uniref:AzlC family ABC transporter permease n=1 Tax=Thalassobacillus sp. CUG 92003 TaxID=2736641 RepID=UPI0015E64DE9|nr:AzlC family ABC transporter permease [Thalassobacillus sp. CUG 92003]
MESKAMNIHAEPTRLTMIKSGASAAIPIMMGYLPIAITYGVLAQQSGMNYTELTLMSVLVFAGAAQFMAANMLAIGIGAIEIIIATFVLNFRHFVMSLSFMNRLKGIPIKMKLPLSLGLTDETFSVASLHPDEAKQPYGVWFYAAMIVTAYSSWVAGSFLGGVLGDVIPPRLSESMGIALYAMFIGLLVPSIKKQRRIIPIVIIAMAVNYTMSLWLAEGWAIVAGTLVGGLGGIWILERGDSK